MKDVMPEIIQNLLDHPDLDSGTTLTSSVAMQGTAPDYALVTAQLLYYRPDHPDFLQSFIWQKVDLAPRLPKLHAFIDFWHQEIDAKLHSIEYALSGLTRRDDWRHADTCLAMH